jgi:Ca2+-binding EF-hand superfamily protein
MGPPPSEDAETTATTIFDELDTNQDGILSLAEIEAGGEKAQNILGADSNEDGEVTFDELVEDITEMHEKMANSDTANKINGLTSLALNTYESAANILASDDSNLSLAA